MTEFAGWGAMSQNAGVRPAQGSRNRHNVTLVIAALALTVGLCAVTAPPVLANGGTGLAGHTTLHSVTPADGALLSDSPTELVLVFTEPVTATLAQLSLTRAGAEVAIAKPQVTGTTVRATISEALTPMNYRIAFRIVSTDGHPVSGESRFTVLGVPVASVPPAAPTSGEASAAPAAASGGSEPTPTYKTPQRQPTSIGHPDHTPGLIVGGSLLLGGGALLLYEQRRRRQH